MSAGASVVPREFRAWARVRRLEAPCASPSRLDRKSTRLNSSHEWKSYAVFCVKKKIPLSHHSVCNDAPSDAPVTLHPYTVVHERMGVGGKPGCRWTQSAPAATLSTFSQSR